MCTYRDDMSLEAMGSISALQHRTQLWVAHTSLPPCCANRPYVDKSLISTDLL